jgi:membrane protein required for colicin V production
MPIADIVIASVIAISVIVGFVRGFVKEAMSIASLLVAVWAAFNFGTQVGAVSESWLSSPEFQAWFGRILIFVVVLTIGGLLSWAIAKLVRLSVLSGTDRALGMIFGFCRGAVLMAVCVMAGQFANFNNDDWWNRSILIPYGEFVADWLRVMAPKGLDLLQDGVNAELPLDL